MPRPSCAVHSILPPTFASSPTAMSRSRRCIVADQYDFRAMSRADLALIRRWLETPEVVRWWGEPEVQYDLVSGDLDHPDMDQFIVSLDGHPFGYIQTYALSTWNQGLGEHPAGTRGIDQFIGEPQMIGRGHGSNFIRCFVDELLRDG